MLLQAAAIALIAASRGFAPWALAATLLGAGTAMVYPTLLAVIGDVAHPTWRASAVGTYRLWRDSGFAVGALVAGIIADRLGLLGGDLGGRGRDGRLGRRRAHPDVRDAPAPAQPGAHHRRLTPREDTWSRSSVRRWRATIAAFVDAWRAP